MTPPREINVHIDRLVIDGLLATLNGSDRKQLQAAVADAIRQSLASGDLSAEVAGGGALASLRGGTVNLSHGLEPRALGDALGSALIAPVWNSGTPASSPSAPDS